MKWKKVIGIISFILSVVCICATLGIAYWKYDNPTADIARVIATPPKQATRQKIVHGKIPRKKVKYDPGEELHSATQLRKYQRIKQPIYLRGYFTIPAIGVYQPVYEGTNLKTLAYGAGTIKPNQEMGQLGNYAIAAHNLVDWYWGHSFGLLQPYNIKGLNAYLINDQKLYMYRLVKKKIVPKTASMPWTENEKTEHMLSAYNQQSDYHVKANSLAEAKSGNNPNGTYYYAPTLTLYTCYEQPPNYNVATHRILVFGIRRGAKPISKMSSYEKSLFPNMFVKTNHTKITSKQVKGKKHVQKYQEQTKKKQLLADRQRSGSINRLIQKELNNNPNAVEQSFKTTFIMAIIFFVIGLILT